MFERGQRVICIDGGPWHLLKKPGVEVPGPKTGDVCVVQEVCVFRKTERTALALRGYKFHWDAKHFRPLDENRIQFARDIAAGKHAVWHHGQPAGVI